MLPEPYLSTFCPACVMSSTVKKHRREILNSYKTGTLSRRDANSAVRSVDSKRSGQTHATPSNAKTQGQTTDAKHRTRP